MSLKKPGIDRDIYSVTMTNNTFEHEVRFLESKKHFYSNDNCLSLSFMHKNSILLKANVAFLHNEVIFLKEWQKSSDQKSAVSWTIE